VEEYMSIREIILHILQYKKADIALRLYVLGSFIEKIEEGNLEIKANQGFDLDLFFSDNTPKNMAGIGNALGLQVSYYKDLLDTLTPDNVDSEHFRELTKGLYEALYPKHLETVKAISDNYQDIIRAYYFPFKRTLEAMFENELVNYIYQNLFPLSEIQSLFERYMMLVIRFGFMRLYLLGSYQGKEEAEVESTLRIISSFTKTIDHHRHFWDYVYEQMKEEEYDHMEFAKGLLFI
jgi:lysine-N-methylase